MTIFPGAPTESSCRPATLKLAPVSTSDGEPEGLVDELAEAVEQLDRAAQHGWRLVGVKLLRDAQGEYRVDARLAPPTPLAEPLPGATPTEVAKAA